MGNTEVNEISFKDLIVNIRSTIIYLFSKWLIILSLIILGGLFGYVYTIIKKTEYKAALSFVLSSESKTSNLNGIASQFGIDVGIGSGGNDLFSGDNIISLFNSKKMIRKALFKREPFGNELLINLAIKDLELNNSWEKKRYLKCCYFFSKDSLISPIQDSLINEVYLRIIENLLTVNRPDKKLSVYIVSTISKNEILSCYLTRFLMDETAEFYINTKTSIAKQNLKMLQKEADSIRNLLGNSISHTASEVDRTFNLNPALQIQRSSIQKGQINATVLGTAYGEVVKNLELAKINLLKETPLYQILDEPTLPLKALKPNRLLVVIEGILIAFVLGIIFLLVDRRFKN